MPPLNPYLPDAVVVAKIRSIVRWAAKQRNEEFDEYINQAIATCHTTIRSWDPAKGMSFYDYIKRHVWRSAMTHFKRNNSSVRATPADILAIQSDEGSSQQRSIDDAGVVERVLEGLSEREREVLTLFARGINQTQIASLLGISRQAVQQTIARVRKRSETQNRKD